MPKDSEKLRTDRIHARQQCHHSLWKFSKILLEDKSLGVKSPDFSQDGVFSYIQEVYSCDSKTFIKPAWRPTPCLTSNQFIGGRDTTE